MEDASARLEAAYREHGPALLAYLRRCFATDAAADDLLQETFVQALRGAEQLSAAASVRAWLFGIARHVAITAVRRRRLTAPLPENLAAPLEARPDPRLERMRAAIAKLPEAQREALELRLRDELSYEEIADVLGIPVGTVRSRLHHAMRLLRERMLAGDDS